MLSKSLVPLAFGQGLDTKRDIKQQLYGTLRIAENVVFETLDSARKRNGYDSLQLITTTGQSILDSKYLGNFKDELLLFTENTLNGYSPALNAFQKRGNIYSVFPTSWPVLNNDYANDQIDFRVVNGLKIFTYRNSTLNEVRYSVQDLATQTMLVTDAVVATGSRPKVGNIGNKIYIFYYAGGNEIRFKTFDSDNPFQLSSSLLLVANCNSSNPNFDIVSTTTRILFAYHSTNLLAPLYINRLLSNNIVGSPIQIAETPSASLETIIDSNSQLLVTFSDGTAVKTVIYTANLATLILPVTTIESGLSNVVKVMVCQESAENYYAYYSISAAQPYNYYIKRCEFTSLGGVLTPAVFMRSVDLASKCFDVDGRSYFAVSYASDTQPTYFVVDEDATILAKLNPGTSGGHLTNPVLPAVYVDQSKAIIATAYRTKIVADNGEFSSLTGIQNTQLDFASENRYQNAALNNNLLIAGGVVQMYDGELVCESGFNVFPEAPTLQAVNSGTPDNSSSLDISAGSYGYVVVYKWTDHQGQEHRSAESLNVDVNVGGPNHMVIVTVPTLRLTQKQNVIIEIYRTEANAGPDVYYLVNSLTVPFFNNPSVDTLVYNDGLSDSALISRRALYTTGGVLENIAPPPAQILATHTASDRIFLAGLADRNRLQYSKIAGPGQPVEFNDALVMSVDPVGGSITALASMDEKLVIFESDAILFISGSGPNNAGEQNTFTTPERVSTDVGCIEAKSVVLTPEGLMFKSRKGIFLLSRALQLTYIGAPVEAYNGLSITSAKVVGELNQVRFTTSDGDALVYNYVYKFWATFTNHKALSAVVIDNDYYYLRLNSQVYKENRSSFSDAGSPIKMKVEIGWISFTTLQGYARVYKMLVLGNWYSSHKLQIDVAYDFKDIYTQQALIDPATAGLDATAYGVDSPYGLPTTKPYGGFGAPYQMRVNFKQQKCQSIKLLIQDVQEDAGQGFSLSQITFQVGAKAGTYKLAKGKQFATS